MKLLLKLLPAFALSAAGLLAAQSAFAAPKQNEKVVDAIRENPLRAGGVFYTYEFTEPELTSAPEGYTPFYISHYGRHGARFAEYQEFNDRVAKLFGDAAAAGQLTAFGQDVYKRILKHNEFCRYRLADLSDLGWEQHRKIAKRISSAYPEIFGTEGASVEAFASCFNRCIMSMTSFCLSLKEDFPKLNIKETASLYYQDEVAPHTGINPKRRGIDPNAYKFTYIDPWGDTYLTYGRKTVPYKEILGRMFTSWDYLYGRGEPMLIIADLYNYIMNVQDTGSPVNLMDVFKPSELYSLWALDNYWYWQCFGSAGRNALWPVLEYFIERCDKDIEQGEVSARLRFGHDTVVISLLTMFNANGMGEMPESAADIPNVLRSYEIPMATTLYLVFYKGADGDIIFKLVHNDKEATLPLQPVTGKYYKWSDFRQYCVSFLDTVKKAQGYCN